MPGNGMTFEQYPHPATTVPCQLLDVSAGFEFPQPAETYSPRRRRIAAFGGP
jgi:hypothetical protein